MEQSVTDIGDNPDQPVSAQLRGETIGYAVQNMGYNLLGNVFEPYINYRVQLHFSGPDVAHHGPHGSYTQNFVGEYAGDFAGSAALIMAESIAPEAVHGVTRKLRAMVDPFYDKMARIFLKKDCSDEQYEDRVTNWKVFQERNLVRTGIIDTIGIAANVATQKWILDNPSPTKLILAGKLASTAVMCGTTLGARFVFPRQMNSLDKWMGNAIAPLINKDDPHEEEAQKPPAQDNPAHSYVENLAKQRRQNQQAKMAALMMN